jgi:hypothetical protein
MPLFTNVVVKGLSEQSAFLPASNGPCPRVTYSVYDAALVARMACLSDAKFTFANRHELRAIYGRNVAKAVYYASHSSVRHAARYDQTFDRCEAVGYALQMVGLMV